MTKTIYTLVDDIYKQVGKYDGWFTEALSRDFASEVASRLRAHLGRDQQRNTLRLSRMGPQCPCALWHSIHSPELAETLPPWAIIKYSYGHVLEALAISFAKASGHLVTGEQDEVVLDGVVGHRDCVIDGCIVDVKSTSSIGFKKFKDKSIAQNDSFGYLDQLDGYLLGSADDPLVTVKDKAYLLAIDKTLGHVCTYEHKLREDHIRERIREYKDVVSKRTSPACTCGVRAEGASGNVTLDTRASYNSFKYCCHPKLRTFLYADGPRYFTKVVRRPAEHIIEIDRYGNVVYN